MKLKPEIISMNIDETQYLVPVGGVAFRGIIRGNTTAGFILEQLKEDTCEEAIVDAICTEYNAPRDTVLSDVRFIIDELRGIGALEE